MEEKVMVSVFCITYNHVKFIKDALDGFLAQKTNFKYQILIHDDASTDGTAEIVKEYAEKYPDIITAVCQTENQHSKGIPKRKTFLCPLAKGKYYALCEGDDYWIDENKLQKQVDFMESHPECITCIGAAKQIDYGDDQKISYLCPTEKGRYIGVEETIRKGCIYPLSTCLYRAELDEKLKIFSSLKISFSDYTLMIKSVLAGKLYSFSDVFSAYRFRTAGSWTADFDDNVNKKIKNCKDIEILFELVNKVTDNRYKKCTEDVILQYKFQILKMQGRIDEMKKEPYRKIYIQCYGFRSKAREKIKKMCPFLRIIWLKMKRGK